MSTKTPKATRVPRKDSTEFEVLKALVDWWSDKSFGPSVDELRELVGVRSKSTVQFHLDRLVAEGHVTKVPTRHATLRPTTTGIKLVDILGGGE